MQIKNKTSLSDFEISSYLKLPHDKIDMSIRCDFLLNFDNTLIINL